MYFQSGIRTKIVPSKFRSHMSWRRRIALPQGRLEGIASGYWTSLAKRRVAQPATRVQLPYPPRFHSTLDQVQVLSEKCVQAVPKYT
jgi:hypothetical protein